MGADGPVLSQVGLKEGYTVEMSAGASGDIPSLTASYRTNYDAGQRRSEGYPI